jgi:membrane protease YdiL (CAAX protease family)
MRRRGERATMPAMARWGRFAFVYAIAGALALSATLATRPGSPLGFPEPWLELSAAEALVYSTLLGAAFGALITIGTRLVVPRASWARKLHHTLRPFARGLSTGGVVVLALLSSIGEELLFRGFLLPLLGQWLEAGPAVVAQALLFGLAHQVPGPSRWVWVAWATVMGACLGAMFALTGSLLGPLVAHALINGFNLAFLRQHDPEAARRRLGGLLGQM